MTKHMLEAAKEAASLLEHLRDSCVTKDGYAVTYSPDGALANLSAAIAKAERESMIALMPDKDWRTFLALVRQARKRAQKAHDSFRVIPGQPIGEAERALAKISGRLEYYTDLESRLIEIVAEGDS